MSKSGREGAFPVTSCLFGVVDEKTGRMLVVVEAANACEAKQRADWVAPFFGWRRFEDGQLQQVEECPDHVPTFFESYFAALGRGSGTLH